MGQPAQSRLAHRCDQRAQPRDLRRASTRSSAARSSVCRAGEPDAKRADESATEVLRCDPRYDTPRHRGTEDIRSTFVGASVPLCVVDRGARRNVHAAAADTAARLPHQHAADRPDRHRQGQGRQADRRADREGLQRHRRRRAAGHRLRRVPADAAGRHRRTGGRRRSAARRSPPAARPQRRQRDRRSRERR